MLAALAQRLEVAAGELMFDVSALPEASADRAATLLVKLPERLTPRPGPELWLYLVAVLGRLPGRLGG